MNQRDRVLASQVLARSAAISVAVEEATAAQLRDDTYAYAKFVGECAFAGVKPPSIDEWIGRGKPYEPIGY